MQTCDRSATIKWARSRNNLGCQTPHKLKFGCRTFPKLYSACAYCWRYTFSLVVNGFMACNNYFERIQKHEHRSMSRHCHQSAVAAQLSHVKKIRMKAGTADSQCSSTNMLYLPFVYWSARQWHSECMNIEMVVSFEYWSSSLWWQR